jgi:hypothetical protein
MVQGSECRRRDGSDDADSGDRGDRDLDVVSHAQFPSALQGVGDEVRSRRAAGDGLLEHCGE